MPDTLLMGTNEILDLTDDAKLEGFVHVANSFCSCDACDTARRAKINAFAESWFARQNVSAPEQASCEQSGLRTVRPPRMNAAKSSRVRVAA